MMEWLDSLHDHIGDVAIQFIPMVAMGVPAVIPAVRHLRRAGMSRAWALLAFFPPWFGLATMVWIVAFSSWKPGEGQSPFGSGGPAPP